MKAQVKNQVTLIGRLGDDPTFFGDDERGGARFDIAVNETYVSGDERREKTTWAPVVCWNALAKSCRHLAKGDLVAVGGQLRNNDWKDADGNKRRSLEIHAADVAFLDVKAFREKKDAAATADD